MTYQEYCQAVQKYGRFSVHLGNNRTELGISNAACNFAYDKWAAPMVAAATQVYLYERGGKVSRDVTPPPRGSRPVVLKKTPSRLELDGKAMLLEKYREFWNWALRHCTLVVIMPAESMDVIITQASARESWDPVILTNLGAVVPQGVTTLSKREVEKGNCCFVYRRGSYNLEFHIFAPQPKLLAAYRSFVLNCQFVLKGLECELEPERRKQPSLEQN